ncbi:tetratricopeptide repeat protein [Chryseobacterium sp. BLS98]|uniref:tetratricopeptide repeat protein n=1 Tax=Chryseobacterium sp. BLS98 TaxID=885586 RepID=UPI000A0754EE|nr:tetratricopeptide repeat protein [Chryseobacterium sp. BLS98]
MKKTLHLFFILFSFYSTFAQNTEQSGTSPITKNALLEKLKYLEKNQSSLDPKQLESMLLQLKTTSEKFAFEDGVLQCGTSLMRLYGNQSRFQKVIHLGEQLKKKINNKKTNTYYISSIYRSTALALGQLGLDSASIKDFKTAVKYAQNIENKDRRSYHLSLCYENMTVYYNNKQFENKKNIDTILYYLNKSLYEIKKVKDNNGTISDALKYDQLAFIDMSLGTYFLGKEDTKENIEQAEKYLLEALKIHENEKYIIPLANKITLLNQVSWLYLEKKEYQKSIDYAKHALELNKQFPDSYNKMESFEFLADSYRELGEKAQSRFYMDNYIFLKDSLNYIQRNAVDSRMTKIVNEAGNKHKENSKKQLIIIGILILIATTTTTILWKRKNKITHKKYEDLIAKIRNEQNNIPTESAKTRNDTEVKTSINITDETAKVLLSKLRKFELSEKYLRKDMSLTWMANHFNTNPKYLSEIIKIYRDKNFTRYINGLRIVYITKKLYENPIYREYKINYLAEECGYATPHVFVTAFKKETGFTPSYFLEQLKTSI